jgi:hypothetical protein
MPSPVGSLRARGSDRDGSALPLDQAIPTRQLGLVKRNNGLSLRIHDRDAAACHIDTLPLNYDGLVLLPVESKSMAIASPASIGHTNVVMWDSFPNA